MKRKEFKEYSQEINKKSEEYQGDGTILIHKNDGRLLITDKNGIYDSFIRSKIIQHGSNFILILISDEEDSHLETESDANNDASNNDSDDDMEMSC